MARFTARYFDGRSSAATNVEVVVIEKVCLEIHGAGSPKTIGIKECKFEAPLGNTRRVILLPDNGRLETNDFPVYDALHNTLHPGMGLKWAHWLERRWRWVILSMAGLIAFTVAFFIWGVPLTALVIANRVPAELNKKLGDGVLEAMDKYFLEPSTLTAETQANYKTWFDEVTADFRNEHDFQLVFRSTDLGANAFALPNGVIVVTDSLTTLAAGKNEFQAVIAHEVGHVINRHSMQMVLRDTGVFVFISTFLGDLTSITSLASAIPTLLIENGYSRSFEKEADLVSGEWLQKQYGGAGALKSILIKLHDGNEGMEIPELMSTHPDLKNRILLLEETFSVPQDQESSR
jgi:Zn-dependent protease with chaperone function